MELIESNPECLLLKNELYVEPVSAYDYSSTARVASVWASVAREKASLAISGLDQDQFLASSMISECLERELASAADAYKFTRPFYICRDSLGNIQGMMELEVRRNEVYVDFLVSNPWNISSCLNENEPNKVRGAGTALLRKAEEIALANGKNHVALTPLRSAIGFYERNGFSYDPWRNKMNKTVRKTSDLGMETLNFMAA